MKRTILAMITLALLSGCSTALVGGGPHDTPEETFDVLWNDFDALYALFPLKPAVDWDDVRARHLEAAKEASTDDELADVLIATMSELDDAHLHLYRRDGEPLWRATAPSDDVGIDENRVRDEYLTDEIAYTRRDGNTRVLAGSIDDIGYLRIATWEGSAGIGTPGDWTADVHDALDDLRDHDALIIDVRSNGGGSFFNGLDVAGRFVSTPTAAFTTSFRDGPNHDDMSPLETWSIEPVAPHIDVPVIVLVDRHCYSANETFILMMRAAGATIVGETTGGAMGTQVRRELPNGWVFRVTVNDTRAPDAVSYEGRGIPVDVETRADESDRDVTLDAAIERACETGGTCLDGACRRLCG